MDETLDAEQRAELRAWLDDGLYETVEDWMRDSDYTERDGAWVDDDGNTYRDPEIQAYWGMMASYE